MQNLHRVGILGLFLISVACSTAPDKSGGSPLQFPGEVHFKNLRQLTAGGTNAEAYWSFDGNYLSYQHKGGGKDADPKCDQIYRMNADGGEVMRISDGGRTTCAYFTTEGSRILFSSTIAAGPECPAEPDKSTGYVWPVYPSYQIYSSPVHANSRAERLKDTFLVDPGAATAYNAETTVCKDGSVIFTSDRDGDLELYVSKLHSMGSFRDVKRITSVPGYDGGAFFSPDCSQIVWRASRPRKGRELDDYQALLKNHLVRPGELELWIANADGTHARQLTQMGSASFAPSFTPDGKRVLFASNPRDPHGRKFDIYLIHSNGTGLERVTFSDTFESFPLFSPNGKRVAFSSNRNAQAPHETNVFVADWVETDAIPEGNRIPTRADRFHATVERLSASEMEGRAPGTPGIARAEDWVEGQFKLLGIRPFFSGIHGDGYRQAVDVKGKTSNNLVGTIGEGCGKSPALLIGAHLDHLGMREKEGKPYAGADDNASGVAGVLELARSLRETAAEKGCIVFAAFTGEESGIIGSSFLTKHLKEARFPLKAMINLDMIGRMENNHINIIGSDSAREWAPLLTESCTSFRLDCAMGGDGYGPSDMMAFYLNQVPVLFFFTGSHADHHQTSDTIEKINATGGSQVIQLVEAVALKVAAGQEPFRFRKSKNPPKTSLFHSTGDQGHGGGGSGAYLGTVPDYSQMALGEKDKLPGVKLADARAGSPAAKAGIKPGDILTAIDLPGDAASLGETIHTERLEDFMTALRKLKPTDKITLHILRNGAALKLPAEVGKRE